MRPKVLMAILLFAFAYGVFPQGVRAEHALLSPPQGTEALQNTVGQRALAVIGETLRDRNISSSVDDALGIALVECETPTCIEETLTEAHADFGFVLAVWKRLDEASLVLTLTLLDRSNHSINVRQTIQSGDIEQAAAALVTEVLRRRAQEPLPLADVPEAPAPKPRRPNAWLAGPIIILAGGVGTLTAGIVGATRKGCERADVTGCVAPRTVNATAVGVLIGVGAAAVAGAAVWWSVGNKRRDEKALKSAVGITPTGAHFRLRF